MGSIPTGLKASSPPESYEELRCLVAETNFDSFASRYEVEDFLKVIAMSADPDELVRRLPYDSSEPPGIWFVLPEPGIIEHFMPAEDGE